MDYIVIVLKSEKEHVHVVGASRIDVSNVNSINIYRKESDQFPSNIYHNDTWKSVHSFDTTNEVIDFLSTFQDVTVSTALQGFENANQDTWKSAVQSSKRPVD